MLWRIFTSSNGVDQFNHGEDPWALVTGASAGLGKSLCHVMAQRGFNVLIHARNQERLSSVQDELQQSYPTRKFETVVADASRPSLVSDVVAVLAGKNLTVLINNAGYTTMPVQPLVTQDMEELERGINIGVLWITQLTRALLPQLMKNEPSLIINVGSVLASHPLPYMVVYAGTKGYTEVFSQSLRHEMQITGHTEVEVQYHEVHIVATNNNPQDVMSPHPDRMARAIIDAVGKRSGFVTPYWVHELSNWVLPLLPGSVVYKMSVSILERKRTDLKKD